MLPGGEITVELRDVQVPMRPRYAHARPHLVLNKRISWLPGYPRRAKESNSQRC